MPTTRKSSRTPRVGLAFGGGLPFGVAAIGVIDVFERNGIPIDCMAGTSMGSIVGLLYAYGYPPAEVTQHFQHFFDRKSLFSVLMRDLRPSRTGFVQGNQIMRTLAKLVPESVTFEELRVPFVVPAADLLTGQEVVFHTGPVLPAIRASISMPGIFVPVPWCGTYLVDGAVITPIPVHLLELLGADIRIPMRAVRKTTAATRQRLADTREEADGSRVPAPDLLRLMWRSLSLIMQDQYAEAILARAPIAIRPEIPLEFAASRDKLEEIIELGRVEAAKHVPAIRAAMKAVQPARRDGAARGDSARAAARAVPPSA
jgi:NTE family protein